MKSDVLDTGKARCEKYEANNARVAWFSLMSLGVCLSVAGEQIRYRKQYFHQESTFKHSASMKITIVASPIPTLNKGISSSL
ncbi:hypothetical protein Bca4012_055949 [Brassica carinata]|uniref:Uncharacterized protein n=1 Tax=Brassica carinata TaxID=52824 RepID=A0A8X7W010_BRACI|nr:hypothetical protein Bca52824_014249 [Brassica carinata]